MNAYNLVNSISSFSLAAINFNDNLINLFEYEFYQIRMKIFFFIMILINLIEDLIYIE